MMTRMADKVDTKKTEPTEEDKRRAAERFVWKPGDVKVIKKGSRGAGEPVPEK